MDVLWTDGVIYPSIVKSREDFYRFDVCISPILSLMFTILIAAVELMGVVLLQLMNRIYEIIRDSDSLYFQFSFGYFDKIFSIFDDHHL